MKKLFLIIRTIIHLQPVQIQYQIWYRLRKIWRKVIGFSYPLSIEKQAEPLTFIPWIEKPVSLTGKGFSFLNLTFEQEFLLKKDKVKLNIPWNNSGYGKLWDYNLNYMDYLLQPELDRKTGIKLIEDFINHVPTNKTGLEPYPISLRGINWIKFLSFSSLRGGGTACPDSSGTTKQTIENNSIASSLYAQYQILFNNFEYHLMANHLLENAFSLLFGAFYFRDQVFYQKAKKIIEEELNEQVLVDGGHFERSPMYHQIILDRLLDCVNLLRNNERFDGQETLLLFMSEKAEVMLQWLNSITFTDDSIPLVNDSTNCIGPTTKQLNKYADSLDLKPETRNLQLTTSGYRMIRNNACECFINIGNIAPSYQPGHTHADTFNFVLQINEKPFIVDTGVSTYEANQRRLKERGTASHNTVTVKDQNSSEVWSSFRVGRRARITIQKDNLQEISASHDGFRKLATTHKRQWKFGNEYLEIKDTLEGKITEGTFHLHLAPGMKADVKNNVVKCSTGSISFSGSINIQLIKAKIPVGYNKFTDNYKVEVSFNQQLKTTIYYNSQITV